MTETKLTARRAADFATSGSYTVETAAGTRVIYRDPENREWYEQRGTERWTTCWLGSTKVEALTKLAALYGAPSVVA